MKVDARMLACRIRFLITIPILALMTAVTLFAAPVQDSISDLKTVAESSNYTATSRFSEVVGFVDRCCVAPHVTRFDFGASVEGKAMVSAIIADPPFSFDHRDQDQRLRILLLGNIHSGECAGKEALLAMLRELAADGNHPWLKDCVVLIAPNYNVDANERIGLGQRPGQVGPERGMGQRENAMQLDLNRDFCKLESPEARSLVGLIDQFDPHMFIDCHTTNGSRHQYVLTYDIPHNPTAPQSIRDYLRNNMMPAVTKALEEQGHLTFYYGNFSRDQSRWSTYGHEPRYSTEYVGLRGRLGILSEAYSYATYQERIEGTDAFVRQCVEHVRNNADGVRELLQAVKDKQDPESTLVHLNSEMAPFPGKFIIKGFDGEEKKDIEVTFYGDYRPVTSVQMPEAYALPGELSMLAERMRLHGVQIEQLDAGSDLTGQAYTVSNIQRAPRQFQKHNMVTLEVAGETNAVPVPAGSFIIRTRQPLGRLVSYMLEPETNEGLVTWNFLDQWLKTGQNYPILRIETSDIPSTVVNQVKPGGQLRLQDIFGPEKIDLGDLSLDQVQWLDGGSTYSIEKNGRRVAIDLTSGAESRLTLPFEVTDLIDAMEEIDGPGRREIGVALGKGITLRGGEQTLFVLEIDGATYIFDSSKKKATRLGTDESKAELAELNHRGNQVAYVLNNNLMRLADIEAEPVALTSDGTPLLLNGKLDWVYQEELYGRGNFKAFWWSPDDSRIAFLRTDESPVHLYPVIDHIPVRSDVETTAYPKAGDPLPNVTLAVHEFASGNTVWARLPENEPLNEHLLSRVTWTPDSSSVLVQVQNRIQSWLDLYQIRAGNGESAVLFRDETTAWIKSPGDPVFLSDGSFLWLSPRSGFNAIYRYAPDGTEMAKLTNGLFEVRSIEGINPGKGVVYFLATPDSPTRVVPMSVRMDGTGMTKLVDQPGDYAVKFNEPASHFLAVHSTATTAEELLLFDAEGTLIRNVIPNRDDQLRHLEIAAPEFLEIPVGEEDSTSTLDAMLIRPADFDANRSYPVLVYVYGGPQAPRVRDRFGGQTYLWHQHLAQRDFVVFVVDNRSCSYRSVKQAWPIYKDLARRELADVEWAVRWLLQENSWADSERIGLWGWSYGGYMTAYALTHSDLFACGISGAPVTDWRNYDAIYTERYMDTPQANETGYQESSVLSVAGNLQGKLLLIHGTVDDNVHISNSMQFVKALQLAGKQFELMVYPENRHAVRVPEQRLHLFQLMTDFLDRNLKPKP